MLENLQIPQLVAKANSTYTFFFVIFGVVAIQLLINYYGHGLGSIPGPRLARFSDIWRLYLLYSKRYASTLQALHLKYGNAVRIGPNIVSLSDPNAIESVYGLKAGLIKSDWMVPHQPYLNGKAVPAMLTAKDEKLHAALKRPIANAYALQSLKQFEPLVNDTIENFIKRLVEEFADGDNAGRRCDIDNWVQYFAFDIITQLTLSREMGFLAKGGDVDGLLAALEKEFKYRGLIGQMPWLDKLFRRNPIAGLLFSHKSTFIVRAQGLLRERLAAEPSPAEELVTRKDLITRFHEARELYPAVVNEKSIPAYVSANLVAGSDTTAAVLRSVIYYTLKHKSVLDKLHAELDGSNLTFPVTHAQALELKYMHAIVREAMRKHYIMTNLLERVVPATGLVLPDGRKLPPGTIVGMNGWTTHFDYQTYGDDAEEFKPERWLKGSEESEEEYKARYSRMNTADMTFSKGSRSCLGKNIADLELHKVVPSLFWVLDMELAEPEREWHVEQGFFTKQSQMDIRLRWRKDFHSLVRSDNVTTTKQSRT